ncbi:MAG: hypothetical protein GY851_36945 [bacterium]|nr:hypothetical protein [bacterium]
MRKQGSRLTLFELFAAIAIVSVLAMVVLPLLRTGLQYEFTPRSCQDNLRRWHSVFTVYLNEHKWHYPPVHGFERFGPPGSTDFCGNINDDFDFCPDWRAVYPEYTTDLGLLACPGSAVTEAPSGESVVDAHTLGVIRSVRAGHCVYEGFPTNGDASYTYLGWRVDRADDGDPYVDRNTALSLGLPAEGPAQIVALLAHADPNLTFPPRFTGTGKKRRQKVPIEPVMMRESLGALGSHVTKWANRNGDDLLDPLWKGFLFGEQLTDMQAKMAVAMMESGQYDPDTMPRPSERDYWVSTPVMWDSVGLDDEGQQRFAHRAPNGANVLYMDGHVEFVAYPGKFPMSESFARTRPVPMNAQQPRVYLNGAGLPE